MVSSEGSGLPRPGDTVGSYRIEAPLGQGGMGVVYRAFDEGRQAPVALKLIRPELASDMDLARFEREAQLAARVDTEAGAIRVHAFGVWRGIPYCAMELVEGEELEALLARGAYDGPATARALERVARTLARCHAKGVIHRDLKPANLLITPDGTPRILDFGVAQALDSERLTRTGEIVGTPEYMAPEQAQGGGMGPATDVYALGVILYRALCGRTPFSGGGVLKILDQICNQPPQPPREIAPDVSPGLEAVCLRAMAKSPEERYASADLFADDLQRALAGEALGGGRGRLVAVVRRSRPRAWAAGWALLLVLLVGAIGLASMARAERHRGEALAAARALEVRARASLASDAPAPSRGELEGALKAVSAAGATDDPLRGRLEAFVSLARHRGGEAVSPSTLTDKGPTARLVGALILAGRGELEPALARVQALSKTLKDAPWLEEPAQRLLDDVLVRQAGALGESVLDLEVTEVRRAAQRLEARVADLGSAGLGARVEAAIRAGLEGRAADWERALEDASRRSEVRATTRLLLKLQPLLRGGWPAPPGPKLAEALERIVDQFFLAYEISRERGRPDPQKGLALIHVENTLFYEVWIGRPLSERFAAAVHSLNFQTEASLHRDVEFMLATFRVGSKAVATFGSKAFKHSLDASEIERFKRRRPRSRALRYWDLLLGRAEIKADTGELLERIRLERRLYEPGLLDDLGRQYERKAAQWIGRDLLSLSSLGLVDPTEAARELLAAVRPVLHPLPEDTLVCRDLLRLEATAVATVEGQGAADLLWAKAEAELRARAAAAPGVARAGALHEVAILLLDKLGVWYAAGRVQEVERALADVAKLLPRVNTVTHYRLAALIGDMRLREDDPQGAEDVLAPVLAIGAAPYEHAAFGSVAIRTAMGLGNWEDAARRADEAVAQHPGDAHLLDLQGQASAKLQR